MSCDVAIPYQFPLLLYHECLSMLIVLVLVAWFMLSAHCRIFNFESYLYSHLYEVQNCLDPWKIEIQSVFLKPSNENKFNQWPNVTKSYTDQSWNISFVAYLVIFVVLISLKMCSDCNSIFFHKDNISRGIHQVVVSSSSSSLFLIFFFWVCRKLKRGKRSWVTRRP